MSMSAEQIAAVAYGAGFRGQSLTTAVAIALAESGGNRKAHNGEGLDNSYGLWQINMLGAMGPDRRSRYHLDDNKDLYDPATNARVAFGESDKGKDFTPWTTYTKGLYRPKLDEARRGVQEFQDKRGDGDRKGGGNGAKGDDRGKGGRGNGGNGNGGNGNGGGGTSGGTSGGGNIAVDTSLLRGYAKETRGVADGLGGAVVGHVRRVREIADDSFGKIGKESGFAAALNNYALALQRQSRGVGENADKLATSASRAAKAYRDRDDEIAQDISKILG